MATISRVVALPSATNYIPIPPDFLTVQQVIPYPTNGDSNARTSITWSPPGINSFKNAFSNYTGYRIKCRAIVDGSPNYQTFEDININLYTSNSREWTRYWFMGTNGNPYNYEWYGEVIENDQVVEETVKNLYNPQYVPATAPTPTLTATASPNFGTFTVTWPVTTFNAASSYSWGGAIASNRIWTVALFRDNNFVTSATQLNYETGSVSIGVSNPSSGKYKATLQATNFVGSGTSSTSAEVTYTAIQPPFFPYFPPYFPPFFPSFGSTKYRCTSFDFAVGDCFSVNCCCAVGCSGTTCSTANC